MAPRKQKDSGAPRKQKDSGASRKVASSKKTQKHPSSQPAKLGLQHFFGRLSQNASQTSQPSQPLEVQPAKGDQNILALVKPPESTSALPAKDLENTRGKRPGASYDRPAKKSQKTPVGRKLSASPSEELAKSPNMTPRPPDESSTIDNAKCSKDLQGSETPKAQNVKHICDLLDKSPVPSSPNKGSWWSPSMMIKQSQDEGGDVVTYHKTPVTERLETIVKERSDIEVSLKASQLLGRSEEHNMSKILLNASTLNRSPIRPCSEKESSPSLAAKLEQWFSTPRMKKYAERTKLLSKVDSCNVIDTNKENIPILLDVQSKVGQSQINKEQIKENGSREHRKVLLELINTAEHAMSVARPTPKNVPTVILDEQHLTNRPTSYSSCLTDVQIITEKQPMEEDVPGNSAVVVASACSKELECDLDAGKQNINLKRFPYTASANQPFYISNNGNRILGKDSFAFPNNSVSSSLLQGQFGITDSDVPLLELTNKRHSTQPNIHFLVLEVADMEYHENTTGITSLCKVLRLLNEQSGSEQILHLCDEWAYSLVRPGDTVNVIGEFDAEGKCVIDHESNLLVIHPDLLISGSRVGTSFSCPRRAVLDERIKSIDVSTAALMGTMLHRVFQAGLVHESPTKEFLEQEAKVVMQTYIESIYATGGNETEAYAKLMAAIPTILNWIQNFKGKLISTMPTVDFGTKDGEKQLLISEVVDIEEMVWSPKYGLKGMFDASVRVKFGSPSHLLDDLMMPLEFKTGRGTTGQAAMEHRAQVILYTLLMSDRYLQDVGSGLIYYLHTNQTQGIAVQHADLVGLIMQRNEHATNLLTASSTQMLPPMLKSYSTCQGCRHLEICTVYHKAQEWGNAESSGLGDLFNSYVSHLSNAYSDFLRHWDQLIDLEARDSQKACSEIWRKPSLQREEEGGCLSSMVLDISHCYPGQKVGKTGEYIYHFRRLDSFNHKQNYPEMPKDVATRTMANSPSVSLLDQPFKCGDHVVLSTEDGRVAVASGAITEIMDSSVTLYLSHQLRLPGSTEHELIRQVWRIDKDETASSFAIMRFNLLQLFVKNNRDDHRRQLIVDLQPPRFDSGAILTQDPAVSYVRSSTDLNDDQRRAILKILSAKDYALILGMPGTGKTSTMVHAVKALLARGASILLSSYTNSAVDNLLLKLKAQGIDFIRLGRTAAIHPDIQEYTISGMGINSVKELESRIDQACVVGVTCLGITHPLLVKKRFDVCIVDEAGQITFPVCLGPIMYARTFVLVGDHYQLPPLVRSAEARENGMSISLFRRLSEAHPQAVSALQCQYRMCAGVMKLSNALIYGNRLRCGSSAVADAELDVTGVSKVNPPWLREVLDPKKSVLFINTDVLPAQETKVHNAINNPIEASILLKIIRELLNGGVNVNDIGVISPYNSQVDLIRRFTTEACLPSLEVHTIDKYQGRDKDCILVSFVRSNNQSKSSGSSLLADWHRINVAITRAKKKLIMVGSQKTLSMTPLLRLLIEQVEEDDGILHLPKEALSSSWLKKCANKPHT